MSSAAIVVRPCPNCNATGCHQWQTLDGRWLCDDCWAELMMEDSAKYSKLREPRTLPKSSRRPNPIGHKLPRTNPARWTSSPLGRGHSEDLGRVLGSTADAARRNYLTAAITPTYNSLCLLCGHVFYGARLEKCSRCGGRCKWQSDHDLALMQRRPAFDLETKEAEK